MNSLVSTSRPTLITILCGFAFVQWILALISTILFLLLRPEGQVLRISDILSQLSISVIGVQLQQSPMIVGLLIVTVMGALIGIWYMRQFAVILYSAAYVVVTIFLQSQITVWDIPVIYTVIMMLLYPIVVIITGAVYFKQMH